MAETCEEVVRWSALWRSGTHANKTEHIMFEDCVPVLFCTRKEAQAWIEKTHGYIRARPDLKAEPHGWKMPIPIRVKVSILKEV